MRYIRKVSSRHSRGKYSERERGSEREKTIRRYEDREKNCKKKGERVECFKTKKDRDIRS